MPSQMLSAVSGNMDLVGDVTIKVDKIEGQNVFLNIALAERPRLTGFYFTGISKAQESGLKDDLNLIRGKIVNDAMVRNTESGREKILCEKRIFEHGSKNCAGKRYIK